MIFYRINSAPPKIVGTQADARREAREAKAKWEEINIPTDKTGLMAFVNALLAVAPATSVADGEPEHKAAFTQEQANEMFTPQPKPMAVAAIRSQENFTTDQIEDFILNRATVAQTENIFACLGTRFAETLHRKPRAEQVA